MKRRIYVNIVPALVKLITTMFGSRNRSKPDASNFFFMIGSGRNGSTLLSSILNNNPEIFIPPEQYVIPFYAAKWQLLRLTSAKSFFSKMYKQLLRKEKTVNWELNKSDYDSIQIQPDYSFYSVVEAIFSKYAQLKGKPDAKTIGEKSPLMVHYWRLFYSEFTNCKYIFLVRDPRDVVYSFSKVEGHEANDLDVAIWKWKDALIQMKRLSSTGVSIITVKYEDLVAYPNDELKRIHDFLGLDFDVQILSAKKDSNLLGVDQLEHHQNLSKPINKSSIGKWKGNLSDVQLSKIQVELKKLAYEFGYDL